MERAFVITFISDDRPGLVNEVASVVRKHGGSWDESTLSQLGGKFAGLVLIRLPEAHAEALQNALADLHASGLSVRVTPADRERAKGGTGDMVLDVLGPDRPGIVYEITQALRGENISVKKMTSRVDSAPMSGESLFSAQLITEVPQAISVDELAEVLEDIGNRMTLEISVEAEPRG